jgi:hypothetical protein
MWVHDAVHCLRNRSIDGIVCMARRDRVCLDKYMQLARMVCAVHYPGLSPWAVGLRPFRARFLGDCQSVIAPVGLLVVLYLVTQFPSVS